MNGVGKDEIKKYILVEEEDERAQIYANFLVYNKMSTETSFTVGTRWRNKKKR